MALEIVGIDETVIKKVTCRNCASIIKYTPSDTSTWETSSMGDLGTATGFDCPKCKEKVVVRSR